MANFLTDLNKELHSGYVTTENGARMYKSTGRALLDLNYQTSSLRNQDKSMVYSEFYKALQETPLEALKWLFYLRDCRGGMGERKTFINILSSFLEEYPAFTNQFMKLIPEYGYWKDLNSLYETTTSDLVKKACVKMYAQVLQMDLCALISKDSYSLASKYAPSDTSKKLNGRIMAKEIRKALGITRQSYRKMLKDLRDGLAIVEKDMSENKWERINYQTVPSKASRLYSNAFQNHDSKRYNKFIGDANNGLVKMHAGQNFPYEILKAYTEGTITADVANALWKNLPRDEYKDVLVVEDRSGSMRWATVDISGTQASHVADSLTLLFSEGLKGDLRNTFMTFSQNPKLWHLSGDTLTEKYETLNKYSEVANTDIEKVFRVLLDTAVNNHYRQEDLPKTILILSDMEFDQATNVYDENCDYDSSYLPALFEQIRDEYRQAGYLLPRLIFWNIASRTKGIPFRDNEQGINFVSGFSPQILKNVIAGSTDAWQNLCDVLNDKRYAFVEEAIKAVL